MNFLLIGPSGVGKTNFINSFIIYLKYKDLEAAEIDPNFTFHIAVQVIIRDPVKFQSYILKSDTNIEDTNENFETTGNSVTQKPRAYEIVYNEEMITLIDTPGVGDTRGQEVDEENINAILEFILQYDKLHAICLFFKSEENRMSESFKYCLQKLLGNLHEKAQNNILFCLTHAAGVDESAKAPAVNIIEKFLKDHTSTRLRVSKDTVYLVDNGVVNYMLKVKHGVNPSDQERELVVRGWSKSVAANRHLIDYVSRSDNVPYAVATIESLLFVKQVFKQLAKPLAMIVSKGTENRLEIEKRRTELEQLKASAPKDRVTYLDRLFIMISRTFIRGFRLIIRASEKRNMYCISHQGCNKVVGNPVCHQGCDCSNKRKCSSINWKTGNCKKCGCSYLDHERRSHEAHFDTLTDEEEFEPQLDRVKKSRNLQDTIELLNKRLSLMRKREAQIAVEQSTIINTCAKLSALLKQTAILAESQNMDFVQKYLMSEIRRREVEMSRQVGSDATDCLEFNTLMDLNRTMAQYDELLNKLINEGQKLEISSVKPMTDQLYSLPLYGTTIKNAEEAIKAAEKIADQRRIRIIVP